MTDGPDIAPGQPFQFAEGKLPRIAHDASFSAAVGKIDNARFDAHPDGKRFHFIFSNVRMKPNASFGGAHRIVVLCPVPGEHLDAAVVHADGDADRKHPQRLFQQLIHVLRIPQLLQCPFDHLLRRCEDIQFLRLGKRLFFGFFRLLCHC